MTDDEEITKRLVPPPHDFWVFAYGSLMWNPEFPHQEVRAARLLGYHRAFCVYSHHYRGTRERPGLVLGLDRGGSCLGRAYQVRAADGAEAAAILDEREMRGGVYDPRWVEVRFADHSRAQAYAYVVDRRHPHYAGRLDLHALTEVITHATGERGSNIDYLVNTVRHLDELGIVESALHELLDTVLGRIVQPAPESGGRS